MLIPKRSEPLEVSLKWVELPKLGPKKLPTLLGPSNSVCAWCVHRSNQKYNVPSSFEGPCPTCETPGYKGELIFKDFTCRINKRVDPLTGKTVFKNWCRNKNQYGTCTNYKPNIKTRFLRFIGLRREQADNEKHGI